MWQARKGKVKLSYLLSFSNSSASSSAVLLTAVGRLLWLVIRSGVWGWVSLRWSPFTGDGPNQQLNPCHSYTLTPKILSLNVVKKKWRHIHTSLLTPATAQMVAVRGPFLKLLYLLSHGHIDRWLLHLSLVTLWQVEGFGHCGTFHSLCLIKKRKKEKKGKQTTINGYGTRFFKWSACCKMSSMTFPPSS